MRSFLLLHRMLALVVSAGILLSSVSGMPPWSCKQAFAAERIVLKYRIFRESLSVSELSTFAENGELSRPLQINLALARQDPKAIRRYLTQPVRVSPIILDRVLNSPVGNIILDQLSQVIHTPSRQADRQALRGALVVSASGDNAVTLIDVMRNYSTARLEVEGDRLESTYRQLLRLRGRWQDLLGN